MSNYKLLAEKIQTAIPSLLAIEVGQIFNSQYYGNIVATKINRHSYNVYSIYGFDETEGMPRDNYYPKDLKLVGREPQLNDVLAYIWNNSKVSDKIRITMSDNILSISSILLFQYIIEWDLSFSSLKMQKDETIERLLLLSNGF